MREGRSWDSKLAFRRSCISYCVCVCKYMSVMIWYVEVRRQHWVSVLTFHHVPGRVLWLSTAVHSRLTGLWDSKESPVSSSHHTVEALGI